MKSLERAIEFGTPVLLENVGEAVGFFLRGLGFMSLGV